MRGVIARLFVPAMAAFVLIAVSAQDASALQAAPFNQEAVEQARFVRNLPLTELPSSLKPEKDTFAILISGDGGLAGLGQAVADGIADNGISVLEMNSQRYFWTKRTPDETATAVAATMRHYLSAWAKRRVILIGYSFGADVLPFVVNRLPVDLRDKVAVVAMLGLATDATFEFHAANWVGFSLGETFPTATEVAKLFDLKVLCIYGADETNSLCPRLKPPIVTVQFGGGHHFGGKYAKIVDEILKAAAS